MPIREDLLNFMQTIRGTKDVRADAQFKKDAFTKAHADWQDELAQYGTRLSDFQDALEIRTGEVEEWNTANTAAQTEFSDVTMPNWTNMIGPQWDAYRSGLSAYNTWKPIVTQYWMPPATQTGGVGKWVPPNIWGGQAVAPIGSTDTREVANPVAQPAEPTSPPQPTPPTPLPLATFDAVHPGASPGFEFVMPESPYSATAKKAIPPVGQQRRRPNAEAYMAMLQQQQSQPKWWERDKN